MTRIANTALAVLLGTGALTLAVALAPAEAAGNKKDALVERGRYIAKVAGCNDCHTPGYAMTGGQVAAGKARGARRIPPTCGC